MEIPDDLGQAVEDDDALMEGASGAGIRQGVHVENIGVVGCGLMGSGIAEVCARAGLQVVVAEGSSQLVEAGRARLTKSLQRAEAKGLITSADEVLGRVVFVDDLTALADRQLVIEAIVEDEQAKTDLFRRLDGIVTDQDAILASNTSSIPVAKIAAATSRPAQVIGVHFFNPVPVLSLVEIVPSLLTGRDTVERARVFVEARLGKKAIECQDRAGFVVNALLIPFIVSAIRMVESGLATADDVDQAMVLGCAHPLGPLALADLIGLDTVKAIAESMYDEYREPHFAPPPLLARMVDAGRLGRKTGRGFHAHG